MQRTTQWQAMAMPHSNRRGVIDTEQPTGVKTKGADAAAPVSGFQLAVPVKIVDPAIVQVVRREVPAAGVEMLQRRVERCLAGLHASVFGHLVGLAQIAR